MLASLSGAKSKGNDTGVKAEIGTIATQAVLYYGLGNTYGVTNYGGASGAYCGQRPDNGNTVYYAETFTGRLWSLPLAKPGKAAKVEGFTPANFVGAYPDYASASAAVATPEAGAFFEAMARLSTGGVRVLFSDVVIPQH